MEFGTGVAEDRSTLEGRAVALYFRRPSTRTRTAFSFAAMRLGADLVTFGPTDLQLVTGETIGDTTRVLGQYADLVVVRTNGELSELEEMAASDSIAVVNALTRNEHPTQAIADLATLMEIFGRLDGVHVLYLGEGNNTAAALALAIAQTPGMRLTSLSPEGYGLAQDVLAAAGELSAASGATVEQGHDLADLPDDVDVVYTTRWLAMGEPKSDPRWRTKFEPYKVTRRLLKRVSADTPIFLHDLPAARGVEVEDEVLDGESSHVLRQSFHKLTSAMAVLEWALADPARPDRLRTPESE